MKNVIHIFGASGSGTTTLGKKNMFGIGLYINGYRRLLLDSDGTSVQA